MGHSRHFPYPRVVISNYPNLSLPAHLETETVQEGWFWDMHLCGVPVGSSILLLHHSKRRGEERSNLLQHPQSTPPTTRA